LNKIETGLCDSNGDQIKIGDKLKQPVTINDGLHGKWAVYEVKQRGMTPIISYLYSEKGEILPAGYLASPLCDLYDGKMFCFARDVMTLRPSEDLIILKNENI